MNILKCLYNSVYYNFKMMKTIKNYFLNINYKDNIMKVKHILENKYLIL